jgi:hypothetical protein
MHFDWTISLGNVITAVSFIVTIWLASLKCGAPDLKTHDHNHANRSPITPQAESQDGLL